MHVTIQVTPENIVKRTFGGGLGPRKIVPNPGSNLLPSEISKRLAKEDFYHGRPIAYWSRKNADWIRCTVIGWQDYRQKKIVLRLRDNPRKEILRTYHKNEYWAVVLL